MSTPESEIPGLNSLATIRLPSIAIADKPASDPASRGAEFDAGSEPSDEALLSYVCGGSTDALGLLFRRYARVVRGIAYRVLRDSSEADDLVQDIFVLIQRLCTTFDTSRGSARHWILQMTYHRAISRRRYLASRHFYSNIGLDGVAAQISDADSKGYFENTLQARLGINERDLDEIFQELSEDQRKALTLRFLEGYTLPEIAERLGQSKANIKNHYFRGIEKLRKRLFSGKLTSKRAL